MFCHYSMFCSKHTHWSCCNIINFKQLQMFKDIAMLTASKCWQRSILSIYDERLKRVLADLKSSLVFTKWFRILSKCVFEPKFIPQKSSTVHIFYNILNFRALTSIVIEDPLLKKHTNQSWIISAYFRRKGFQYVKCLRIITLTEDLFLHSGSWTHPLILVDMWYVYCWLVAHINISVLS